MATVWIATNNNHKYSLQHQQDCTQTGHDYAGHTAAVSTTGNKNYHSNCDTQEGDKVENNESCIDQRIVEN